MLVWNTRENSVTHTLQRFICLKYWGKFCDCYTRDSFVWRLCSAIFEYKVKFLNKKLCSKNCSWLKETYFTVNIEFVTSNQIPTYRKSNLPLTSSIYLVFFPLEMQGTLIQTKVYHTFFHFVWKETTHKPLKVAAAKPFSPVCMLLVQLASMNVFYSMW